MKLKVLFFAKFKEEFKLSEDNVVLDDNEPTVLALLEVLRARGGVWSRELGEGRAFRIAVNHEMVDENTVLGLDDEVALFPPVTGG